MGCVSVILLVLSLLILVESAPTRSKAQAQWLQRFPFEVQNQIREQLAIKEAIDMNKILKDIVSSIFGGDLTDSDMLRRLAGILTKIDEDPDEFGGKEIGNILLGVADLIEGLQKTSNEP